MTPTKLFKCLSDSTRLTACVLVAEVGEACVCDLMTAIAVDQPKLSRHLAELRKCGLLQGNRRGKWVYYRLHPELAKWAQDIIAHTAHQQKAFYADALAILQRSQTQSASSC